MGEEAGPVPERHRDAPGAGADADDTAQPAPAEASRRAPAQWLSGLYVILDPQAAGGRPLLDIARAALLGGARVLQLRDKVSGKGEQLPLARELRDLCERYDALLFINDHADLARACDAHGYHGGQRDLPVAAARTVLAPHQLVGRSNALVDEAAASHAEGADYVAVGDVFGSPSKADTRPAGLETLRAVRARVRGPVAAIGGITTSNVHQVVEAGADMACVISAVAGAGDPQRAASLLVERMEQVRRTAGGS